MSPTPARDAIDPVALGALAVAVAREAGALLLELRDGTRASLRAIPNDADLIASNAEGGPFTVADRAAEELIVRRIIEARPTDGIISEEGTCRDGGPVRWIADPLDGSANYLRGIPHFSVSIAAEVDGVTVAAAVFNPVVDEMFHAVVGLGAMLNGTSIRPSDERRLSHALVATGFGGSGSEDGAMQRQTLRLQAILPVIADLRRTGSAALDICWVACGRLDAYYEAGQYPWDVAAADLIVREAGGWGGTLDGAPLSLDRTWVAANTHLFSSFRDLISSAAPDPGAS